MNANRLGILALQLRIALMRFGWTNSIGVALCSAAIIAALFGIPHLHERGRLQEQAIVRAQQALQSASLPVAGPAPTSAAKHLTDLNDVLGDANYTEQQVKTLFALASKNNLTLSQAEYKLAFDKEGHYQTYQILLPIKGDYQSIRQFCEQTLLAIPFASLDDINFKRDGIASRTLEAKLHFTLYLSEPQSPDRTRSGVHDEL